MASAPGLEQVERFRPADLADWNAIGRAVEIARNFATLILGNGDLKDPGTVYCRVRGGSARS